ncbi:MAG: Maf family protein [Deltaproteobacteria bacterium]
MTITKRIGLFTSQAPLILASASPRRRSLLEELGLRFKVRIAAIDEKPGHEETPESFVRRLAEEKARAVSLEHRAAWILAADTVVVLDTAILNKPANREEALAMLLHLSGRGHHVLTGFCLLLQVCMVRTEVEFMPLSREICEAYVYSGEPMDKAGAYGIQGQGGSLVRRIEGSYTNVMGLPLAEVIQALLEQKVIAPARTSAGNGGIS